MDRLKFLRLGWESRSKAKWKRRNDKDKEQSKVRTFKCLMSDDIFYGQGLVFDFWIYLYLAVMEPTWIRNE